MTAASDFSFLVSRSSFLVPRSSFLGGSVTGPPARGGQVCCGVMSSALWCVALGRGSLVVLMRCVAPPVRRHRRV